MLPSSKREMAVIGPIVRNDYFFSFTMLALVVLMVLMEYRRRKPAAAPVTAANRRKNAKLKLPPVVSGSGPMTSLPRRLFLSSRSRPSSSTPRAPRLVGRHHRFPLTAAGNATIPTKILRRRLARYAPT